MNLHFDNLMNWHQVEDQMHTNVDKHWIAML